MLLAREGRVRKKWDVQNTMASMQSRIMNNACGNEPRCDGERGIRHEAGAIITKKLSVLILERSIIDKGHSTRNGIFYPRTRRRQSWRPRMGLQLGVGC